MTTSVRRASAFAVTGVIALAAPVLGEIAGVPFALEGAAVPFLLIAAAAVLIGDGPLFDLFARPADYEDETLRGLFGFAASAAVLGGIAAATSLPTAVFIGTVLLVAVGNLCSELAIARGLGSHDGWFVVGGTVGLSGGFAIAAAMPSDLAFGLGSVLVFVAVGALAGGLVRSMLFPRDDPPVMFSVALGVWLLVEIIPALSSAEAAFAIAVTGAVGIISYLLDTASVEGMIAGVLLGLIAFVLGGPAWFVLLLAFFAIGGLSSKFQYDEKVNRGIAEGDEGARGGENVLANSTAAMIAVIGFATASAAPTEIELIGGTVSTAAIEGAFALAYAGALATALGDTLSSEIGGVYDNPRLITTFEPVPAGTDGAITWQGELAGIGGTTVIALLAVVLLDLSFGIGLLIILAGIVGMTVDSLLGATIEGKYTGNEGVNFLATLAGGIAGGIIAIIMGFTLP